MAKITQAEAKAKSGKKKQQILDFASSLEVKLMAEQQIIDNRIRTVVVFMDMEQYEIADPIIRAPGPRMPVEAFKEKFLKKPKKDDKNSSSL